MKRALCIHLLDDFSGSAKVCSWVAEILKESGWQLKIWVGSAGEGGFIRTRHPDATTFFYMLRGSQARKLAAFAAAQLLLFFRVLVVCMFWRPHAVYVSTMLPTAAVLAGRLACCRVICHVHEVPTRDSLLLRVSQVLVRIAATDVICVSRFVAQHGGYGRYVIVYNSLPDVEWSSAREIARLRASTPHRPFQVMMACSLKWYKGIHQFTALATEVCRRGLPYVFTLVLNCERDVFEAYAQESASKPVALVWRPASMYTLYAESDLVVNLSNPAGWTESFALTLLEAMATGIPVVGPSVGGPLELFTHGAGGWHMRCDDERSLLDLIERLAKQPEVWRHSGSQASRAAERFAPTCFRSNILRVFATGSG